MLAQEGGRGSAAFALSLLFMFSFIVFPALLIVAFPSRLSASDCASRTAAEKRGRSRANSQKQCAPQLPESERCPATLVSFDQGETPPFTRKTITTKGYFSLKLKHFFFSELCRSTIQPERHDGSVGETTAWKGTLHRALPHPGEQGTAQPRN